jgi:molybdopterin adenylyltransferase
MAGIDETRRFVPINIAVLTVSDTRTLDDDRSGSSLVEMIQQTGHNLADRQIVRDDIAAIRATVSGWTEDESVDCVLTTGGTGFTGRDVTPDALQPMFDKHIDGFATLFHMLSYQSVATSTMQSRACGGLIKGTYVFCLPGSPGACRDAWNGILRYQLDSRHQPCNLVEIMPRLNEHLQHGG